MMHKNIGSRCGKGIKGVVIDYEEIKMKGLRRQWFDNGIAHSFDHLLGNGVMKNNTFIFHQLQIFFAKLEFIGNGNGKGSGREQKHNDQNEAYNLFKSSHVYQALFFDG
jgi:hypothetical protein